MLTGQEIVSTWPLTQLLCDSKSRLVDESMTVQVTCPGPGTIPYMYAGRKE